jgi:hypothetical protein
VAWGACDSWEWRCKNGRECIRATSRCDGKKDCSDGSDEQYCPTDPPPGSQCMYIFTFSNLDSPFSCLELLFPPKISTKLDVINEVNEGVHNFFWYLFYQLKELLLFQINHTQDIDIFY